MGGALYTFYGAIISDSVFEDCSAELGGALFAEDDTRIENATFRATRAGRAGGAVAVGQIENADYVAPALTLTGSAFADTQAIEFVSAGHFLPARSAPSEV